eukprot:3808897-Rhodomonas_salina.1
MARTGAPEHPQRNFGGAVAINGDDFVVADANQATGQKSAGEAFRGWVYLGVECVVCEYQTRVELSPVQVATMYPPIHAGTDAWVWFYQGCSSPSTGKGCGCITHVPSCPPGTRLRDPATRPGTNIAYGAACYQRSPSTDAAYGATRCLVLRRCIVLREAWY